jgi:hypothetical protein
MSRSVSKIFCTIRGHAPLAPPPPSQDPRKSSEDLQYYFLGRRFIPDFDLPSTLLCGANRMTPITSGRADGLDCPDRVRAFNRFSREFFPLPMTHFTGADPGRGCRIGLCLPGRCVGPGMRVGGENEEERRSPTSIEDARFVREIEDCSVYM